MIKDPEVKKGTDTPPKGAQPPAPTMWAVFAIDKKAGGKIQITKTRQSRKGANFDKGDIAFGADQCLLTNKIVVDSL